MTIQPNWQALTGVIVAVVVGHFLVGWAVRKASHAIGPLDPPSPELADAWSKLTSMNTAGNWIGLFERPLFFAALWLPSAWPLLTSWLVFKLAFYWQGANFTSFPTSAPSRADAEYFAARRKMGSHHVSSALVGTAANIFAALVGVAIGRWVKF